MSDNNLLSIMLWVTPVFALLAILYKLYAVHVIKQKYKLRIPLRLLSFYKNESIYSTRSNKKRDYMTRSNYLTLIIYTCILPDFILVALNVGERCTSLLDSMLQ